MSGRTWHAGDYVTPERARAARIGVAQREATKAAMRATAVASARNAGGIPPATRAASVPCRHWSATAGYCGQGPTRRYLAGFRCPSHAPDEPHPDPTRSAAALFEQRRRQINLANRASGAQLRAFLAVAPVLLAAGR